MSSFSGSYGTPALMTAESHAAQGVADNCNRASDCRYVPPPYAGSSTPGTVFVPGHSPSFVLCAAVRVLSLS